MFDRLRWCGMKFHERLAVWRASKGLSQAEIGKTIGVTRQSISYVEAGTNSLSVDRLEIICRKAFKIDLATFFGELP
jgi:transcriptional regulator with XRE-family HTH domain